MINRYLRLFHSRVVLHELRMWTCKGTLLYGRTRYGTAYRTPKCVKRFISTVVLGFSHAIFEL